MVYIVAQMVPICVKMVPVFIKSVSLLFQNDAHSGGLNLQNCVHFGV